MSKNTNWTSEKEQVLLKLREQDFSYAQIAITLQAVYGDHYTEGAIRGKLKRLNRSKKQVSSMSKPKPKSKSKSPTKTAKKQAAEASPITTQQQESLEKVELLVQDTEGIKTKALSYVADANETLQLFDATQEIVTVNLPADVQWQLLIFAGDWHIGAQKVDIRRLIREAELIAQTPHCWYVFVGDTNDNFIAGAKHAGGQHEQSVPPKVARIASSALFDILGEKLLAVATGCHDDWSIQIDDFNLVEELAHKHNCAYLGYGGKVHLDTGNVMYEITAMHKFRMNSSLNIDHACRRYLQMEDMDNDVVAIAHNHTPFVGVEYIQDRPRVLIRTAAYKGLDRYAQKLMFRDGVRQGGSADDTFMPCVLFNTQDKVMRVAHTLQEGVGLLHYLNNLSPEDYETLYGEVA